jgi:hypothetical protein
LQMTVYISKICGVKHVYFGFICFTKRPLCRRLLSTPIFRFTYLTAFWNGIFLESTCTSFDGTTFLESCIQNQYFSLIKSLR